jgi:hypothetical protein
MSSFGDLLNKYFPNTKVQAATQPQVPVPSGTTGTKPTTSFGDLMKTSTSSVPKATTASVLTGSPSVSANSVVTGGSKPNNSSSGYSSTVQNTGISIPAFSFDWTAADQEALDKLTPYYNDLLNQAKGDLDLAKSRMEEDYARGVRQRSEDQLAQTAEDTRTSLDETRNTLTNLNSRGVLVGERERGSQASAAPMSDYANSYYLSPLKERQQARALAIQRAFMRAQESADIEKSRTFTDAQTKFERYKQSMEEEKKNKAINEMAPLQYQQELSKYNTALSGVLNA